MIIMVLLPRNASAFFISDIAKSDTLCGKIYSVKKISKYRSVVFIKDTFNRSYKIVYLNKRPTDLEVGKNLIGSEVCVVGKFVKNKNQIAYYLVTDARDFSLEPSFFDCKMENAFEAPPLSSFEIPEQ